MNNLKIWTGILMSLLACWSCYDMTIIDPILIKYYGPDQLQSSTTTWLYAWCNPRYQHQVCQEHPNLFPHLGFTMDLWRFWNVLKIFYLSCVWCHELWCMILITLQWMTSVGCQDSLSPHSSSSSSSSVSSLNKMLDSTPLSCSKVNMILCFPPI